MMRNIAAGYKKCRNTKCGADFAKRRYNWEQWAAEPLMHIWKGRSTSAMPTVRQQLSPFSCLQHRYLLQRLTLHPRWCLWVPVQVMPSVHSPQPLHWRPKCCGFCTRLADITPIRPMKTWAPSSGQCSLTRNVQKHLVVARTNMHWLFALLLKYKCALLTWTALSSVLLYIYFCRGNGLNFNSWRS